MTSQWVSFINDLSPNNNQGERPRFLSIGECTVRVDDEPHCGTQSTGASNGPIIKIRRQTLSSGGMEVGSSQTPSVKTPSPTSTLSAISFNISYSYLPREDSLWVGRLASSFFDSLRLQVSRVFSLKSPLAFVGLETVPCLGSQTSRPREPERAMCESAAAKRRKTEIRRLALVTPT